jgi:hypothetical protein
MKTNKAVFGVSVAPESGGAVVTRRHQDVAIQLLKNTLKTMFDTSTIVFTYPYSIVL